MVYTVPVLFKRHGTLRFIAGVKALPGNQQGF